MVISATLPGLGYGRCLRFLCLSIVRWDAVEDGKCGAFSIEIPSRLNCITCRDFSTHSTARLRIVDTTFAASFLAGSGA